jgi:hypothetical protein
MGPDKAGENGSCPKQHAFLVLIEDRGDKNKGQSHTHYARIVKALDKKFVCSGASSHL